LVFASTLKNLTRVRHLLWWAVVLFVALAPSTAQSVGVMIVLDQPARTTEQFRPVTREIGLSLTHSEIPLLKAPTRGLQTETEINYRTGYVQLRTYYQEHHITAPLALEIRTFNTLRNDARVVEYWRQNLRLSLRREQFQKQGAGLAWTFASVPKSVRAILGEGGIGLKVNGYRKITFSGTSRWQGGFENTGSYRQSKFPSLDMKQQSQFTIKGNVGSKIYVTVDQDSQRESDLSNQIQIRYKGDEDDILQTVELGNTNLSLPNTKFVGYSQRIQGLFGVKATAKLGNLDLTMITSQEKGNTEKTRFTAGSTENITYLRDYQYHARVFFDVGRFGREDQSGFWQFQLGRDSIVDFKLYVQGASQSSTDPYANMYIDPSHPNEPSFINDIVKTNVRELKANEDYFLEPNEFWIQLEDQLRQTEFLACWMTVRTPDSLVQMGSLVSGGDVDTLTLKLLKRRDWSSGSSTWDYEWKNVYYLGAKNLQISDFEFDIYKGAPGNEEDNANLNHQDGSQYLQILGLDRVDDNGNVGSPDKKLDNSAAILDLDRGLVVFPDRTPFNPAQHIEYLPGVPDLAEKVPTVYTESNPATLRDNSVYYLRIAMYSKRTATYSLKRINILEGSETVTLDQRRLTRGVDYTIDYEIGQITFLNEQALDPNADLTIDFEYAPFISAEKKSLFGMRAEYNTGPDFSIGSSFLYKGQKSTDRKPKLGQEQSKDMIGEVDFSYTARPTWMTSLADAVPFVETSVNSTLRISGEIARSMPNPNSEGQVIIDDFEGAELSSDLGLLREYWTVASPPDSSVWPNRTNANRNKLTWYNPYLDEFLVTEIWDRQFDPGRSIPRHKVLVIRTTPDSTESWAGIMRGLSTGLSDQSRARILEIRLGTKGDVPGQLHIDLGEISEDVDGDGSLDTEDKGTPTLNPNGTIDPGEDTGLDGEFSHEEEGYDPVTNPDPVGDDWAYDDKGDPYNYERINGTEGNSSGDRYGIIPDTEDLNGNNQFEETNNYYSYTIDLLNSPYLVDSSQFYLTSGVHAGLQFRTYRIPVWGQSNVPENAGQGDSTLIRFARLWLDNFVGQDSIYLASLEIVENRWQAEGLSEDTLVSEKSFRAEVINSEENSDYTSPPGVGGYYDRQADLTEKEQSLLLKFEHFEAGDTGWASKTLTRTEDYTGYRYLKMWVHGDPNIVPEDAIVSFVFRMGNTVDAYYEYHVDLEPGWAEENKIYFDFDELTPLKETGEVREDSSGVLERWSDPYKIRGNPSLTQIRYLAVGITYKTGNLDKISGDIWVDELILSGVRRDQGTAMRLSVSADFADLAGFSVNSEQQSYSFRQLTAGNQSGKGANLLNGSTRTSHDANTRISLDKFLPASWRMGLPVTLKYTRDVSVPKLMTGSDIVLTPELQKDETTTKISHRFSIAEKVSLPTKHWLAKVTVNAFSMSGSMSRDWTWSPLTVSNNESYTVGARYDISFSKLLPITPLSWTRYLLLPKRVWNTKLSLVPKSFRADGSIQRTESASTNSVGSAIYSFSRRFKGQADWTLAPFPSLSGSYGISTERDLYDPRLLKFSFNPRDILFGQETKFTQRLGARYDVPFFTFLSPGMTYNVDYTEDSDPKRYQNNTRKAAVNANLTASAKLDIKRLLGSGGRGGRRKTATRTKEEVLTGKVITATADSVTTEPEEKKKENTGGGGFRPHAPFLWVLRQLTSPVTPITGNYRHRETRSALGLLGRPTLQYRFGFISDHGQEKDLSTVAGRDRDNENLSDEYSLNSSVDLFGLTDVKVSYDYRTSSIYTTTSTRQRAQTFPQLSTTLNKLDRIILLNKIAPIRWVLGISTASANYSKSFTESEKFRDAAGDSADYWGLEARSNADDWGATLKLTQNFRNGWQISADYGWKLTHKIDEGFAPARYQESRQTISAISLSTSYSFRAPNGVRFPLLRNLRLKSTLALNLSIKLDTNSSELRGDPDDEYGTNQDRSGLTLRLRANYSFSSTMKGGFDLNWTDAKDNMTNRTNHTRQVNIYIEFSF
jgi:hypothetical protein